MSKDNETFSIEIPIEEIQSRASSGGISWSGWYGGSSSNTYNCRIGIAWSSSGNTSNNTSSVTATAYFYSSAVETYGVAKSGTITINGNSSNFSKAVSYGDWGSTNTVTLASHNVSVAHNSDGNKSITISVSWAINITYAGTWIGTMSHSVSATLDTLLSPPSAPTWCIARGNYEAGEKVAVSWGGASGTISSYNVAYRQWDTVTGWTNWSTAGTGITGTSMEHQIISVGDNRQCLQYRVEARNASGASDWSPGSGYVYHYGVKVNQSGFKWATVKVWDGSTWQHAITKIWDGSSWRAAK